MDYKHLPLDDWTESHVSEWLQSVRLKEEHISKLYAEEVTGPVVKKIQRTYLKKMGMKEGQIELFMISRDELFSERAMPEIAQPEKCSSRGPEEKMEDTTRKISKSTEMAPSMKAMKTEVKINPGAKCWQTTKKNEQVTKKPKQSLKTSPFRPFDEVGNFRYIKNQVLSPETGITDLISPCHEYKLLAAAGSLHNKQQLQAKLKFEYVRFAAACLNARANGTIHFGIGDSAENKDYEPGQIVGISIKDKDLYCDVLNDIKECFTGPFEYATARLCIRPPQCIEVIDEDSKEQPIVIEVDVVPLSCTVKGKLFQVCLPRYEKNKIYYGKRMIYERNGTKSVTVKPEELSAFTKRQEQADIRREKAESDSETEIYEDFGKDIRREKAESASKTELYEDFGKDIRREKAESDSKTELYEDFGKDIRREKAESDSKTEIYEDLGKDIRREKSQPASETRNYEDLGKDIRREKSQPVSETENCEDLGKDIRREKSQPASETENCEDLGKDIRREKSQPASETGNYEDLGKELSVLLTNGKQYFDDTQWYVVVTNRCEDQDLEYLKFLKDMNILCVFDFDPESDSKGLCSRYKEFHATNIYSLESYSEECGKPQDEIIKNLCLFKQTCWVFCNGRTNFLGGDKPCDERAWTRQKGKCFKRVVSLTCDEIIRMGSFSVLFLLLSPVEKPIVDAFNEFYREMSGLEYITCIAENKENYERFTTLAQTSCTKEELDARSIVGMKLSHVSATVCKMLPTTDYLRYLPASSQGKCILTKPDEERMHSLNILCVNECSNINLEKIDMKELEEFESLFYRGGKISWKHFWLAEQKQFGRFIERHGCSEVETILEDILTKNTVRLPVARIRIVHHPGSGGSTVAHQILWKNRNHLRCAVVNSSYPVSTVSEHALKFREYEEKNIKWGLPVLLLLEDCEEEYIDDLKHDLGHKTRNSSNSKPSFILLSCNRSNAPERLSENSTHDTVAITHKLNVKEKELFKAKAGELSESFSSTLIISFVLMSNGFEKKYLKDFVENALQEIDHSSVETRLLRYIALLSHYVQGSYISVSHCEAFLGLQPYFKESNKLSQCHFINSLSDQAKLLLIELRESTSWISGVRILHPLIAEELLQQLSNNYPQSKIAMDLLQEEALFHHKFGRVEFVTFIRHLFLRRHRISRGDNKDTFFSPLIEEVWKKEEAVDTAIKLMEAAYARFDEDAFFAQQLARLHYRNERFEEARKWAETAKTRCPHVSFILDTEAQVYKKWFNVNMEKYLKDRDSEDVVSVIELGLKSMECFKAAQKAAKSETETMNSSGYFGEVDVGCRLLELLSKLDLFSKQGENTELLKYLLTKYIPEELKNPWSRIHGRLKGLYQNIYDALEWISEEVGYFQTDKINYHEEAPRGEDQVNNPRRWLIRKTRIFANFFHSHNLIDLDKGLTTAKQFVKKMGIYELGGGSTTTILSLLSDSKQDEIQSRLEKILEFFGPEMSPYSLDDIDLINYIMCHIALGSVHPESTKLLPFQRLRDMSRRFLRNRKQFPPSAYLIIFLLFWPDDKFDERQTPQNTQKDSVLTSAVKTAKQLHERRLKNVPVRKKRTNVLFFLGKGYGFRKFVHRSTIERVIEEPLNERTLKSNGNQKTTSKIQNLLQSVSGWTENGKVYTKGKGKDEKIEVLPLNYSSVPFGNENVTFYLGFTYIGFVAYNVQVSR
uniref:SAM domain-containing protein n=1 Tax=Leptobrachium leishanense TaxID=445787 RepID=A0A8C5R1T1_9ANUR